MVSLLILFVGWEDVLSKSSPINSDYYMKLILIVKRAARFV